MRIPVEPTADRDLAHLSPKLNAKVIYILERLRAEGYHPLVLETRRSPGRQAWLRKWRPGSTRVVHSRHQDGEACDIGFMKSGKVTFSRLFPGYARLGKLAKDRELAWGGRWRWFKDIYHVELP